MSRFSHSRAIPALLASPLRLVVLTVAAVTCGAVAGASRLPAAERGDSVSETPQNEPFDQSQARRRLHQVVSFYRNEIGYQGAYLWRYSADLTAQEGEGEATKTSGWTQPPGTPAVGEAYLDAWRVAEDPQCLEAALEVARALVRSQLQSGGWGSRFDLGPAGRKRYAYRVDGERAGKQNYTTFDDNKSQSALLFLMHVDEALGFRDEETRGAVDFALEKMLAAQYPNGAWPQQYDEPPEPADYPVVKASYPERWPRQYPKEDYRDYYTLNDNNMSDIIEMLLEAHRIYDRDDCYQGATKTGDFFRLAQMPAPQPGWAQQYNRQMHPSWARKFEPPAITGGESQSVMRALLRLYRFTGQAKFLEPLPSAIAYYRDSLLPDGKLARFYELHSNRPLYFTKEYELTYSDRDLPTHYTFQVSSNLDGIEREYKRLASTPPDQLKPKHRHAAPVKMTPALKSNAQAVLRALDNRGAWVEPGKMRHAQGAIDVIEMRTLIENLAILARYVGAKN